MTLNIRYRTISSSQKYCHVSIMPRLKYFDKRDEWRVEADIKNHPLDNILLTVISLVFTHIW